MVAAEMWERYSERHRLRHTSSMKVMDVEKAQSSAGSFC